MRVGTQTDTQNPIDIWVHNNNVEAQAAGGMNHFSGMQNQIRDDTYNEDEDTISWDPTPSPELRARRLEMFLVPRSHALIICWLSS